MAFECNDLDCLLLAHCTNDDNQNHYVYIVDLKLATDYSGVQTVAKVQFLQQPFMQREKVNVVRKSAIAYFDSSSGKLASLFSLSTVEVSF